MGECASLDTQCSFPSFFDSLKWTGPIVDGNSLRLISTDGRKGVLCLPLG